MALGGGGSFSTTTVNTPFSHLAVMVDALQLSGSRNFLSSFWDVFLSSLMYLHPSSSPSSRFLFPLLLITSVFSSSTVTCKQSQQNLEQASLKYEIVLKKEIRYLNIRFRKARNIHVEYVFLGSVKNVHCRWNGRVLIALMWARRRRRETYFLKGLREIEEMVHCIHNNAHFCAKRLTRIINPLLDERVAIELQRNWKWVMGVLVGKLRKVRDYSICYPFSSRKVWKGVSNWVTPIKL